MDEVKIHGRSGLDQDPGDTYNSMWMELRGVPFSQGWLKAGDINTRYLHTGSSAKPALIFLHGFIGHAEAFIRNLAAHGEYFNTYAIDMMGTGYSDKPDFPYHAPVIAQQVAEFMDAAGLKTASVLGTSYGSRIATRFAINYPDRLDKLTLSSVSGIKFNPESGARILSDHSAIDNPSWEQCKKEVTHLFRKGVFDDLIACRQAIVAQPEMIKVKPHLYVPHKPETGDLSRASKEEYRTIQAPALVIQGVQDGTYDTSGAEEVADAIPNARLVLMEGCGHAPYFQKPEKWNKIHLDFLLDR